MGARQVGEGVQWSVRERGEDPVWYELSSLMEKAGQGRSSCSKRSRDSPLRPWLGTEVVAAPTSAKLPSVVVWAGTRAEERGSAVKVPLGAARNGKACVHHGEREREREWNKKMTPQCCLVAEAEEHSSLAHKLCWAQLQQNSVLYFFSLSDVANSCWGSRLVLGQVTVGPLLLQERTISSEKRRFHALETPQKLSLSNLHLWKHSLSTSSV